MSDGSVIHRLPEITGDDVRDVREVVDRAAEVDGFSALNEAALLHLVRPTTSVRHLLATSADGVVGYAQLDATGDEVVGSLVVDPGHRRAGIGDALLTAAIGAADGGLRIWAPHDTRAAGALAARHELRPVRTLLIMERALDGHWPAAPPPPDVRIRAFRPRADDDAWLAVNARAFAGHPEQGRLGQSDLDQRLAEPWFDAAGFLLAEREGGERPELVGFHWTKQHPDRVGEVYVLGVDPTAGIRGLGRPLLIAGLDHLRATGDNRVILYVEGDNAAARRLYDSSGFTVASADVLYAPG